MNGHDALFSEETVKPCKRAGIAALSELDPEDNETIMRISAAHIADEFDLGVGMLIRVMVRASGTVAKRVPGAVITAFPTIDILPVGLVLY